MRRRLMDGCVYVVESVEPNEDVSLEGFTSCNVSVYLVCGLSYC